MNIGEVHQINAASLKKSAVKGSVDCDFNLSAPSHMFVVRILALKNYEKKRRLAQTPEPGPKIDRSERKRFVVQEHRATRLHWDFRLELDGVLKSWAVPKGPPEEPGLRRLAVEVEDHPVDYITFEGTIPTGNYGAGYVKIWDKGTFRLKRRTKDLYEFWLKGKRLNGKYALVRFKEKNWLMLKSKSED